MGRWHAYTARQLNRPITAVIDQNLEAAQRLAGRFGGKAFPSLQDALSASQFDVVHICTPLSTHYGLAKLALEAGKHVLVEKPIAETCTQAGELMAMAAEQGVLLCPVHQFAFQPGVDQLRREMASRVAPPTAITFDFASAGGEGKALQALNQILVEILPHPFSILLSLWPDADSQALDVGAWLMDNPAPGELFMHGHYRQIPVSIKLSLSARPTHCHMKLYHAAGAVHVNLFHGYAVQESARVSRFTKLTAPFSLALKTLWAAGLNLVRRALQGEPAYPGLKALVLQFYTAVETSGPAPLPDRANQQVAAACAEVSARIVGPA